MEYYAQEAESSKGKTSAQARAGGHEGGRVFRRGCSSLTGGLGLAHPQRARGPLLVQQPHEEAVHVVKVGALLAPASRAILQARETLRWLRGWSCGAPEQPRNRETQV